MRSLMSPSKNLMSLPTIMATVALLGAGTAAQAALLSQTVNLTGTPFTVGGSSLAPFVSLNNTGDFVVSGTAVPDLASVALSV